MFSGLLGVLGTSGLVPGLPSRSGSWTGLSALCGSEGQNTPVLEQQWPCKRPPHPFSGHCSAGAWSGDWRPSA